MRRFPERPVVGVGAVVLSRDGRVLLVKRAHAPLMGEWSLPGGGVEVGETLDAAVAREVLEETGMLVSVGPVVEVLDRIEHTAGGKVEYHFVIVDYLCHPIDDRLVCGSDADDARWVPIADLEQFRPTEALTRVIAKAVELAGGG